MRQDTINYTSEKCDHVNYVIASRCISSDGIHAMRFGLVCNGDIVSEGLTIHDLIELDASIQTVIKLHDNEA